VKIKCLGLWHWNYKEQLSYAEKLREKGLISLKKLKALGRPHCSLPTLKRGLSAGRKPTFYMGR